MNPLLALVEDYVAASSGMRFEAKKALWDLDDPEPILHPEESRTPLIGWPAIDAYWSETRSIITELRSRASDRVIRLLVDDIALCRYTLRWRAQLRDSFITAPIAGDNRVTLLARLTSDGWRIFHYVECSLSLATVAQRLAARNAANP